MSLSRGTPLSVVLPSASRHAAMIGNALFLLPLISILPFNRVPPRIRKLSIAPILGPAAQRRRPRSPNCPRGSGTPALVTFGLSAGPSADYQQCNPAFCQPDLIAPACGPRAAARRRGIVSTTRHRCKKFTASAHRRTRPAPVALRGPTKIRRISRLQALVRSSEGDFGAVGG